MKKFAVIILLSLIPIFITYSQDNGADTFKDDETFTDTLNRNTIGLNVFPAFGMLGGGSLANTKIYIQYKHYFDKVNFRTSLNFITFQRPVDKTDLFLIYRDTLSTDPEIVLCDTSRFVFRKTYHDAFAYDARFGLEAAFPHENFRFHVGAAAIIGYQYIGEFYYHYEKSSTDFPVEWVNISREFPEERGYYKNHYLKTGVDFSLGVDINVSPNVVFTLQLTPELAYFKHMNTEIVDPDGFYSELAVDKWMFTPDYIDFIVSIRF